VRAGEPEDQRRLLLRRVAVEGLREGEEQLRNVHGVLARFQVLRDLAERRGPVRGGSSRVRVFAGLDPVTGCDRYLAETVRGTPRAARREAEKALAVSRARSTAGATARLRPRSAAGGAGGDPRPQPGVDRPGRPAVRRRPLTRPSRTCSASTTSRCAGAAGPARRAQDTGGPANVVNFGEAAAVVANVTYVVRAEAREGRPTRQCPVLMQDGALPRATSRSGCGGGTPRTSWSVCGVVPDLDPVTCPLPADGPVTRRWCGLSGSRTRSRAWPAVSGGGSYRLWRPARTG